jgi:hypothetical protein
MTRSEVAGWLLAASFVLWFPAAALPSRVWAAPAAERLALIAQRRRTWQAVNLCIAGAAVVLVLGFTALAEPLRRAGAGALVPLSLIVLLLGAALWLATLTFRVTAMAAVAGTEPPAGFAVLSAWAGGLFLAWSVLANAAVVGFGAAVVRSGYPASWCGWAAVALGALLLAQLVATGDALPAIYHVGPGLIGVALLVD